MRWQEPSGAEVIKELASYGAFIRNCRIRIPQDAVCVFARVAHEAALESLRSIYGAGITASNALMQLKPAGGA